MYFKNIAINELYQLTDGTVHVETEGAQAYIDSFVEELDAQDSIPANDDEPIDTNTDINTPQDTISIDGVIDSVFVNPSTGDIVVITDDGEETTYTQEVNEETGEKETTLITDSAGNSWVVDKEGNVSGGGAGSLSDVVVDNKKKDNGYYITIPNDTTKYRNGAELVFIKQKGNLQLTLNKAKGNIKSEKILWVIEKGEECEGKAQCEVSLNEKGKKNITTYLKNGKEKEKLIDIDLTVYKKPIIKFEVTDSYNGQFGYDNASFDPLQKAGDYKKLDFDGTVYYVPFMTMQSGQQASIQFYAKGLSSKAKNDKNFNVILKSTNSLITINWETEITIPYQDLAGVKNPRIPLIIQVPQSTNLGDVERQDFIIATDHKGKVLGEIAISFGELHPIKDVIFVYVDTGTGFPSWSVDDLLNFVNLRSHNQFFRKWDLKDKVYLDLSEDYKNRKSLYISSETALPTLKSKFLKKNSTQNSYYYFITNLLVKKGTDQIGGQAYTSGQFGALYDVNKHLISAKESTAHEFGHLLGLKHSFENVGARIIPKGTTKNYMDYISSGRNMFFIYQIKEVK